MQECGWCKGPCRVNADDPAALHVMQLGSTAPTLGWRDLQRAFGENVIPIREYWTGD